MKIVQINATCGVGSTGKICVAISEQLTLQNIENYILYSAASSGYPLGISCADSQYIRLQALKARVLGNWGFNSQAATKRMIVELDHIQPDVVHLHNIHGHDCDLEMLFRHFRQKGTKLYWTFHDCWTFTGYCTYFTMVKCSRWKTGCGNCPQRKTVSWFFDRSHSMWERKKRLFSGLDLTIITPSQWLADLVKESFLTEYPVKVIHNGIDLQLFRPTLGDFRQKHGLEDKHIVLGVAFDWGKRKGLDVFLELEKRLGDQYKIVLVGTDEGVEKRLPPGILSIPRTKNQQELAEIYSAANVLANPTREDNFPTVNLEALACGTPVVTFRTGGSPECLDETCGFVVDVDDLDGFYRRIRQVCEVKPFSEEACLARASCFAAQDRYAEYVDYYQEGK